MAFILIVIPSVVACRNTSPKLKIRKSRAVISGLEAGKTKRWVLV
jgi:hypothetical protein